MKLFVGFLLGMCTVIGTVVGVFALGVNEEEPDINEAQRFLSNYFSSAPIDPANTWGMLTSGYIENRSLSTGQPFNFDVYRRYFLGFDSVRVGMVRPSDTFDGWFEAAIEYEPKGGGRRSTSKQVFQLVCPAETRYPAIECGAGNLQINRVVYPNRTASQAPLTPAAPGGSANTCPRYRGECETYLSFELLDATYYGPAGAWLASFRVFNDGDYPTRDCSITESTGFLKRFSLQASGRRDLEVLLRPDPPLPAQSLADPDPPRESAVLEAQCQNVRDIPSSIRLAIGD